MKKLEELDSKRMLVLSEQEINNAIGGGWLKRGDAQWVRNGTKVVGERSYQVWQKSQDYWFGSNEWVGEKTFSDNPKAVD
jgi:hypothetical protein